ncbi:MAG: hypothetical protein VYE68_16045 [Acidobacteriota bacterium]|nr:hypothetical protein [Acidobacteriota bacterium]
MRTRQHLLTGVSNPLVAIITTPARGLSASLTKLRTTLNEWHRLLTLEAYGVLLKEDPERPNTVRSTMRSARALRPYDDEA